ncbi:MAG: hypothetical protein JNM56_36475 [Planctomycetia bacterium]|nr:hypothetical protein [Planctomycetia bacterium]
MRNVVVCLVSLLCALSALAQGQKLNPRYNLQYNSNGYSQESPKDALNSVLKAIKDKRVDYLLAHLTDPDYVDERVKIVHRGDFAALVKEATKKLIDEPETVKRLIRFANEGEWETGEKAASVQLKELKEKVYLRKVDDRWFLENDTKKAAKAENAEK